MQKAIELIQEERYRQQDEHAFTYEHDDAHDRQELAFAAAAYALPDDSSDSKYMWDRIQFYPFNVQSWKPSPDNRIRELVKAGALIVAEIERLQRLDVPGTDTGQQ